MKRYNEEQHALLGVVATRMTVAMTHRCILRWASRILLWRLEKEKFRTGKVLSKTALCIMTNMLELFKVETVPSRIRRWRESARGHVEASLEIAEREEADPNPNPNPNPNWRHH